MEEKLTCKTCGGLGKFVDKHYHDKKYDNECPDCKGTGLALLPCPFCGGEPYVVEGDAGYYVTCSHCNIGHEEHDWSFKYAVSTYNKRAK